MPNTCPSESESESKNDNNTAAEGRTKRERPPIVEGEDRALEEPSHQTDNGDTPSVKTIAEREMAHKHLVEDKKIIISAVLLAVCFAIIVVFAGFDAYCDIESALFTGAFDFAKTIATAVIGYLFATNSKDR